MKIAQISPLYEAVPPKLYGGTERVVGQLCESLVDLGHEVTLFASGDARTRAELVAVREQAIRLDPSPLKSDLASHLALMAQVLRRQDSFDVLHFHTDMVHFPFFERVAARTVTTLHGRLDIADLSSVYGTWSRFPLVSISDAQRIHLPEANWAGTVYHGMDAGPHWFNPNPEGYLAFLGRVSPEKGPVQAISIAKRVGQRLRVAAKVDTFDAPYFREQVAPLLDDPQIEFLGEIDDAAKPKFLGGARALLFPIDWPEPFGLVMIEAMACGTPVVAFRRGSTSEVIDDGVTGFVVDNEDEAVEALLRAERLDRRQIRRRFDERFSGKAMAQAYLDIYARLQKRAVQPRLGETISLPQPAAVAARAVGQVARAAGLA